MPGGSPTSSVPSMSKLTSVTRLTGARRRPSSRPWCSSSPRSASVVRLAPSPARARLALDSADLDWTADEESRRPAALDDACGAQRRDLVGAQAQQSRQDLVGVATERGARVSDAPGRQRELGHDARLGQRADSLGGHVDDHLAGAVVGVAKMSAMLMTG